MIRIENFVGPSPQQWEAVIRGMRNPMNSWKAGDSDYCMGTIGKERGWCEYCSSLLGKDGITHMCALGTEGFYPEFHIGEKDMKLAKGLIAKGVADRKFLRQLPVIMDITAPLYWWRQMSTYKIGTTADSCSQMHKLMEKEFEFEDFSYEKWRTEFFLDGSDVGSNEKERVEGIAHRTCWEFVLKHLNWLRVKYLNTNDKKYWRAVVELLPQSYNQRRTWSANYEVLRTICHQRKGHKLKEWADFIQWVRENVPYAEELIF